MSSLLLFLAGFSARSLAPPPAPPAPPFFVATQTARQTAQHVLARLGSTARHAASRAAGRGRRHSAADSRSWASDDALLRTGGMLCRQAASRAGGTLCAAAPPVLLDSCPPLDGCPAPQRRLCCWTLARPWVDALRRSSCPTRPPVRVALRWSAAGPPGTRFSSCRRRGVERDSRLRLGQAQPPSPGAGASSRLAGAQARSAHETRKGLRQAQAPWPRPRRACLPSSASPADSDRSFASGSRDAWPSA